MTKKNEMGAAPSTALVKATADAAIIPLTKENIVKLVNPHASPEEVALFLNVCAMFQLNPFKREIYLIKYDARDKASFVVGYESYLKRADRTNKWAGMASGTIDDPKTGIPVKAWAKIFRKDWAAPLEHEVYYTEYVQYAKDGKGGKYVTKFWREKPRTMLKKVAIAQAMRMAFPDEFGGMPYTAEEMPVQHETLDKGPAEVVETKREPAKNTEKETAGAPPEPAESPSNSSDPAASDDLSDMAETAPPELTEEQRKAHEANIGAIKMVLKAQDIEYKDFKKFLLEIQSLPKNAGKGTFVRVKFGNPSLSDGNPADVLRLLKNIDKILAQYVSTRIKEEKDAKSKKG